MTGVITNSTKVVVEMVAKDARGAKASITQPGNRQWVTVIQAVGANGRLIDPLVIIKGASVTTSFAYNFKKALGELPHASVAYSDNGWSNAGITVT